MSREASLGKAKQRSSHAAGQRDARDMGECWIPSSAWPEGKALMSTRQRHTLAELVCVPVFHVALLGTIVLSCPTGAAPGQVYWVPPRLPILDIKARATMAEELVPTLRVGSELIVLEHTTLDTVKRRLGAGSMGEAGAAASFVQWLCLYGRNGQGRWVLWLESGEMGAGRVEGFHVVSVKAIGRIDRRCSLVERGAGEVVLPKNLALGIPDSAVQQALGKPSAVAGDTLIYLYWPHVVDSLLRGQVGSPRE